MSLSLNLKETNNFKLLPVVQQLSGFLVFFLLYTILFTITFDSGRFFGFNPTCPACHFTNSLSSAGINAPLVIMTPEYTKLDRIFYSDIFFNERYPHQSSPRAPPSLAFHGTKQYPV